MTSAEWQIRKDCPNEAKGRELIHDERVVAHQRQLQGVDVWYVPMHGGKRQYFVKRDDWPPYYRRYPQMWYAEDMMGSIAHRERSILKLLFEHGMRLDEYQAKGAAIKAVLTRLRQKGKARSKAVDALLDDVRYELFTQQSSTLPRLMEGELDEAGICQYAWYFANVLCLDRCPDQQGNLPEAASCQGTGIYLQLDDEVGHRFLSCAVLASLEPASSYGIVLSRWAYNAFQRRIGLEKTLGQLRGLGLTKLLYIGLDETIDAALITDDSAALTTWYDPMRRCLVDVYPDEGQPDGIRLVPRDIEDGVLGWVEHAGFRTYHTFVPLGRGGDIFQLFHELEQASDSVAILGGYIYTKGDAHDQSSDDDYYFVKGVDERSRFGIEDTSDDNTWYKRTTFFRVSEIEPYRPYSSLYVRIGGCYFAVAVSLKDDERPWFRRHEGELLSLRLTDGCWEDAQEAVQTLEQLLSNKLS